MRYLLVLIIAISVGYTLGFQDAREHDKPIVVRIVEHIEDANRDKMGSDADKKLEEIERK
jgi:hypothetical protein